MTTSPSDRRPVAIVGGGPVGLCAALALAHHGIPFVLLEDDDGLSTEPKAGTILPSSLELFAQLGLAEAIAGAGVRCPTIDFLDRRSGRVVTRMQVHELATETRHPIMLNLPQDATERVLHDALVERGHGDALRFGRRVTGLSQDAAGCRLAVEGSEDVEASYVLGCDGGRSAVRQALGIESVGRTYPETFALFNVRFADERADRERTPVTFVFDPDEWMILVRLPGFWRVVWPVPRERPEPTEAELRDQIRFAFGADHAFEVVGRARYNVHHRHAAAFRAGRAFLLGDSAHLMTPVGGLGLNTGLQDVGNLIWKLAWVLRGDAGDALLDSYERERLPVARFITGNLADRNRSLLMLRHPLQRLARNAALGLQARSRRHRWAGAHARSLLATRHGAAPAAGGAAGRAAPPAAGVAGRAAPSAAGAIAGLGLPAALAEMPARLAAVRTALLPPAWSPIGPGDRAPDGPLRFPDGRLGALHELIGRGFVALTFCDARSAEQRPDLSSAPVDHWLVSPTDVAPEADARRRLLLDLGGRLTARYGASPGTTYVLRPDGWVLTATDRQDAPGAIERYLASGAPPTLER